MHGINFRRSARVPLELRWQIAFEKVWRDGAPGFLALYTGLRRQTQIAGIVAHSGALPYGEMLRSDIRSKPPVLLVHGEADDVVPFRSMANAKATLEAAGVPVTAVARPGLGHAVDDAGIALAGDFLRDILKAPQDDAGLAV